MNLRFDIHRDRDGGFYELICRPGYSIDGQHYFIADTRSEARELSDDIRPCSCDDCRRALEA